MTPGERLREWRREHGWTVYRLAEELRCSPTTVHHWQAGRRRPSDARRARLERLAGIPADAWAPIDTPPERVASTRAASRRRYRTRKAAGLCVDCEQPTGGPVYCGECIHDREVRRAS